MKFTFSARISELPFFFLLLCRRNKNFSFFSIFARIFTTIKKLKRIELVEKISVEKKSSFCFCLNFVISLYLMDHKNGRIFGIVKNEIFFIVHFQAKIENVNFFAFFSLIFYKKINFFFEFGQSGKKIGKRKKSAFFCTSPEF